MPTTTAKKASPAARAAAKQIEKLEAGLLKTKARLAALQRAQPRKPVKDYVFRGANGKPVRLSRLFGDRDDLIVVHHMGAHCAWCCLWADGYDGLVRHIGERAAFVVASDDPVPVQKALAKRRGWGFRMVSSRGTPFFRDMGFEPTPGMRWPGFTTFARGPRGRIVRVASRFFGPGDDFCGLWHFFDLLADGAKGWQPKL